MPTDRIILVGAGGHALVVIDALTSSDAEADIVIVDENPDRAGQMILGRRIELLADRTLRSMSFHLCIGDNDARERISRRTTREGGKPVSIMHPSAVISSHAEIAAGAFVILFLYFAGLTYAHGVLGYAMGALVSSKEERLAFLVEE